MNLDDLQKALAALDGMVGVERVREARRLINVAKQVLSEDGDATVVGLLEYRKSPLAVARELDVSLSAIYKARRQHKRLPGRREAPALLDSTPWSASPSPSSPNG